MGGPLREPTYLILVALADEERHGYGIIREVEELSGGRLTLGPGTLYGALDRLKDEGLIRPTRTEVVDGRHRRYYALTPGGVSALRGEVERRAAMQRAVTLRLARRPGVVPG